MKRFLTTSYKLLSYALICALTLFSLLFAVIQTKWAKKRIQESLISAAATQGVKLSIDSVEGRLPFRIIMKGVRAHLPIGDEVTAKTIKLRLGFFPLLRREISIASLNLYETSYILEDETALFLPPLEAFDFPFSLSIKSLKINSLHLVNQRSGVFADFSIDAAAKIKRHLGPFSLEMKAISGASWLEFFIDGKNSHEKVALGLSSHLESLDLFKPFKALPLDGAVSLQASLEGPKEAWIPFFSGKAGTVPLTGHFKSDWQRLEVPGAALLNRRWKSDTTFFLTAENEIKISDFALHSNLAEIYGKCALSFDGTLRQLSTTFSVGNLALFPSILPLAGSLQGSAKYDKGVALVEVSSNHLQISAQSLDNFRGQLLGSLSDEKWKGKSSLHAHSSFFFVDGSFDFEFLPTHSLLLKEIQFLAPDSQLSGELSLSLPEKKVEGSLLANFQRLSHFDSFLPGSLLEGTLGGALHFKAEPSQAIEGHLHAQNLRYKEMVASDIDFTLSLFDLDSGIKGSFFLEGERTYFPELFLSSYSLSTQWKQNQWPFELHLQGRCKEPLELHSTGLFKQEGDHTALALEKFFGSILNKPFSSYSSPKMQWEKNHFQLSDFGCFIDNGELNMNIDLSDVRSLFQIHAEHLPIDLFALLYPSFSPHGMFSLDTSIKANKEEVQGYFNLTLEEAEIEKFGQEKPIKAKGSLQANLDRNIVQLQADLKATQNQFLQWTATLPIEYTLLPFKLKIDENKALSSELVLEGKLEEIFDFINVGSHRFSGLLSTHLFLSKTLASPSLQGNFVLENGSYENDFTGTNLKSIQAKGRAERDEILLTDFIATDGKKGKAEGTGKVKFQPAALFPYTFRADLDNLNYIRFEMISSNFSGPLEISGNLDSATAKGSLTVPEATFNIPDTLPPDIAKLDVTFVNMPPHLQQSSLSLPPLFPFFLDLDLSAKERIFVKGKGLNSEWQGETSLKGTNIDIAANGSLNLIKGDFSFSGKSFKLTQGEITFSDNPKAPILLSLSGFLTLPDMTITASLRGPLASPQLTFSSVPELPTSSILAHILFNKDISEISPVQAIQLAQTIMTLSGKTGTDVLETIRKTIGVDKLNIASNNSEEISVQVGKYLTRGVMITLAQSAESSQVIVEVELKHGFILQAETQENQEGKFSFKWNKNY